MPTTAQHHAEFVLRSARVLPGSDQTERIIIKPAGAWGPRSEKPQTAGSNSSRVEEETALPEAVKLTAMVKAAG